MNLLVQLLNQAALRKLEFLQAAQQLHLATLEQANEALAAVRTARDIERRAEAARNN